jgi:glutaredoxin
MRRWLWLVVMVLACKTKLAPFEVRDDSAGLLFTWVDEQGRYHVEASARDVPVGARESVRVVDPAREEGTHDERVFLVNLSTKNPDGTYPVKFVTLNDFEKLAAARKAHANATGTGTGTGPGTGTSPGPNTLAPDRRTEGSGPSETATVTVIIYGASWCGPCHDAERYLRKRGIPYAMKDVERDANAASEMQSKLQKSGRRGSSIPVIDVGGKILVGYSEMSLEEALGKAM